MAKAAQASLRKRPQKNVPRLSSRERWSLLGFSAFLLVVLGLIRWFTLPSAVKTEHVDIPPFMADVSGALPTTLNAAQFTEPVIREAYQIASQIPTVLAQQPCFCGCSRMGHGSLLDCYHSLHATSCDVCIKEALLANRMYGAGKTAEEIRAAIIRGEWSGVH